jgi:flagellar hook-length control protein FliK
MTIGLNDIKNTGNELIKEKSSKKDENSSLDYSTISDQFASIFSTQVNNQFQSQFDYQKMYTPASSAGFTASVASTMTDNSYVAAKDYAKSEDMSAKKDFENVKTSNNSDAKETASDKNAQLEKTSDDTTNQQDVKDAKSEKTADDAANQQDSKEVKSEKTSDDTTNQQDVKDAKSDKTAKDEHAQQVTKTVVPEVMVEVKPDAVKAEENKTSKTAVKAGVEVAAAKSADGQTAAVAGAVAESIKVAVKQTDIKATTETQTPQATQAAKTLEGKTVTIEKIELQKKVAAEASEIKNQVKQSDEKVIATKDANEKAVSEKAVNAKVEDIKKQAEMERITSNVITQNSDEEAPKTSGKSTLDGKTKHFSLNTEKAAAEASKVKTADSTSQRQSSGQSFDQNFGSNSNFSKEFSGQQNQSNESNLTQNLLNNNNIAFDSSLFKNTISGNMHFNNVLQDTKTTGMVERNITDQVMKQIQGNLSSKDSQLTMILQPEKLGKVTLSIMNEKGALSAEIKTESKEAADALTKNINDLKETLKSQGVTCANLVVKVETPDSSQNQMQFSQQDQHNTQDFSQGNASNSNKNQEAFENKAKKNTVSGEYNQEQNDIQENQEMPAQTQSASIGQGVVDYRV